LDSNSGVLRVTVTRKVVVYALAERAEKFSLFPHSPSIFFGIDSFERSQSHSDLSLPYPIFSDAAKCGLNQRDKVKPTAPSKATLLWLENQGGSIVRE
jgi:hypothetical protein